MWTSVFHMLVVGKTVPCVGSFAFVLYYSQCQSALWFVSSCLISVIDSVNCVRFFAEDCVLGIHPKPVCNCGLLLFSLLIQNMCSNSRKYYFYVTNQCFSKAKFERKIKWEILKWIAPRLRLTSERKRQTSICCWMQWFQWRNNDVTDRWKQYMGL